MPTSATTIANTRGTSWWGVTSGATRAATMIVPAPRSSAAAARNARLKSSSVRREGLRSRRIAGMQEYAPKTHVQPQRAQEQLPNRGGRRDDTVYKGPRSPLGGGGSLRTRGHCQLRMPSGLIPDVLDHGLELPDSDASQVVSFGPVERRTGHEAVPIGEASARPLQPLDEPRDVHDWRQLQDD